MGHSFFTPWYELPPQKTISSKVLTLLYDSVHEVASDQGHKVHFTVDLWSGGQHGPPSLTAHWCQPEDLRSGRASVTGLQGEALVLPPDDRSVLLQAQDMAAWVMGRKTVDEFLKRKH